MLQYFFLKKMMQSQLKDLPEDQREKILKVVNENPELFIKMSREAQEKIKGGLTREAAMMEVLTKHQGELRDVLGGQ